jgi:peptidoglycan hydrolase-like protein with peptidoglycan-binding domain
VFGPATKAAVEQFQRQQGLVVDGIVGPQTWGRLQQSPSSPPTSARRMLRLARPLMVGDDVRALQRALTQAGFPLVVDGAFSPATDRAVRQYQTSRGLVSDGIVGPQTRSRLGL